VVPRRDNDIPLEVRGKIHYLVDKRQAYQLFQKPNCYWALGEKREPPRKRTRFPYEFINHRWYRIKWENSEYWTEPGMKFTQIDFLNNDIPDYPDSDNNSDSGEETTTEEQEATETTQDIADSSSESNRRTLSPPTQKEAEPEYLAPTTPIDDAMSQLNLNLTQPTSITQAPPLILRLATATMTS
jgi:hypothetical protein